jgi:outer membrane phospholipase A
MKQIPAVIVVLLVCTSLFAQENIKSMSSGISGNKSVYAITGFGDDQVKIQLSLKYDLLWPFLEKTGLYIGYTQLMFWDLYSLSSPFATIDFSPEVFWRFESKNNFAGDVDIPFVDYIQLGFAEHCSNGEDDESSRGYTRSYLQFQLSTPFFINFGINVKAFYFFDKRENPDIEDYLGNYEATVFLRLMGDDGLDLEQLYVRFASGGGIFGFDFSRGFIEIGAKTRPILARIRPYIQFYKGYGQSLTAYDVPTHNTYNNLDFSLRLGITVD